MVAGLHLSYNTKVNGSPQIEGKSWSTGGSGQKGSQHNRTQQHGGSKRAAHWPGTQTHIPNTDCQTTHRQDGVEEMNDERGRKGVIMIHQSSFTQSAMSDVELWLVGQKHSQLVHR